MPKVGIITYHSAYNFGSCLQAFATLKAVSALGCETYIINYRPQSQYDYYRTYRYDKGLKEAIRSLTFLPAKKKYSIRKNRYEEFIKSLNLTEEVNIPEECSQFSETFDVYISGSDQIWNKHSNELKFVDWKYMNPYLLSFTSHKKISYASSLVGSSDSEIEYLHSYISDFAYLSCREDDSTQRLSKMLNRSVQKVIDPTLLVNGAEWEAEMGMLPDQLRPNEYVLFYSLQGIKELRPVLNKLKDKVQGLGYKVVIITPLAPYTTPWAYNAVDAGPREFMRLIHDAAFIITNSYHGSLFSVNFGKNFFSICSKHGRDSRIADILTKVGLEDRIRLSIDDIDLTDTISSYDSVHSKIKELKKTSVDYLRKSILTD